MESFKREQQNKQNLKLKAQMNWNSLQEQSQCRVCLVLVKHIVTEGESSTIPSHSKSILKDGQSLCIQLLLPLLPFFSVQLLKSFVSQNFKFLICLFQFSINILLVGLVLLCNCELLVVLVPFGVSSDGVQLPSISLEVSLVVFLSSSLHDGMFWPCELLCCSLHFSCQSNL